MSYGGRRLEHEVAKIHEERDGKLHRM